MIGCTRWRSRTSRSSRRSGFPDRLPLRHGARLGEHYEEVLTEVGGLTADEIDPLLAAGVVATEPPE